ncbi:hypothetical protein OAT84_00215 [Gammaproteobacteria bacterium]|nr:hypothetical protein [Gammaproteobacteria bacterium]
MKVKILNILLLASIAALAFSVISLAFPQMIAISLTTSIILACISTTLIITSTVALTVKTKPKTSQKKFNQPSKAEQKHSPNKTDENKIPAPPPPPPLPNDLMRHQLGNTKPTNHPSDATAHSVFDELKNRATNKHTTIPEDIYKAENDAQLKQWIEASINNTKSNNTLQDELKSILNKRSNAIHNDYYDLIENYSHLSSNSDKQAFIRQTEGLVAELTERTNPEDKNKRLQEILEIIDNNTDIINALLNPARPSTKVNQSVKVSKNKQSAPPPPPPLPKNLNTPAPIKYLKSKNKIPTTATKPLWLELSSISVARNNLKPVPAAIVNDSQYTHGMNTNLLERVPAQPNTPNLNNSEWENTPINTPTAHTYS